MKFYCLWLMLFIAALSLKSMQKEYTPNPQKPNLHDAVDKGDIEQVKDLLLTGADVNAQDASLMIPLHWAVGRGYTEIIDLLIKKGSDIEKRDIHGRTPLHMAVQFGSIVGVQALMEVSDFNAKDNYNRTPLLLAVRADNLAMVEILLSQKRIDVNVPDIENSTPLHFAATRCKETRIMKLLLDHGANVNTQNKCKDTPLSLAIWRGATSMAKLLLSCENIVINYQGKGGKTPLHISAEKGLASIVSALLEKKAKVDVVDDNGWTPLHYALIKGHKDTFSSLLTHEHRNINDSIFQDSKIGKGTTFLHFAVAEGSLLAIKLLLDLSADVNCTDGAMNTPLHYAAKLGHMEIIESLLNKGASKNVPNKKGMTPLYLALLNDHDQIAQFLLTAGVNVNELVNGKTMLHLATQYGHTKVAKKLLALKADVKIPVTDGKTAFDSAVKNGHDPLIALLSPVSAVNCQDSPKITPLKTLPVILPKTVEKQRNSQPIQEKTHDELLLDAAKEGNIVLIKDLLARGANINAQNKNGETALHTAIKLGDLPTSTFLCSHYTLDPNVACQPLHMTPLHMAITHDSPNLCDAFVTLLLKVPTIDVKAQNCRGKSPVELAQENDRCYLIPQLLHHGAQVDLFDSKMHEEIEKIFQDYPLLLAVFQGNVVIVEKFAKDVDYVAFKEAMLLAIAQGKSREIINKLMGLTNRFDGELFETLHESFIDHAHAMVARCRDKKMLKSYHFILNQLRDNFERAQKLKKPSVSSTQAMMQSEKPEGQSSPAAPASPLLSAAIPRTMPVVSLTDDPHEFLLRAAREGNSERVMQALQNNARIDVADMAGRTPLHFAVICENDALVTILLNNGADSNKADKKGFKPLHYAALQGNVDIVRSFISRGDSVDSITPGNKTLLHHTALANQADVAEYLLSQQADVNALDAERKTPLSYALQEKNPFMVLILLNCGAAFTDDEKQLLKNLLAPIHWLILQGNMQELAKYCTTKQQEIPWLPPFSPKELERALLLAAGQRHPDMVKFLLDYFEISTDKALRIIAILLKKVEQSHTDRAVYTEIKHLLECSPFLIQKVPYFLYRDVTSWFNQLPKELLPLTVAYFIGRKVS